QKRTNLILVETSGAPCTALVRLVSTTGLELARRSFDVQADQYLQINDVFGPGGVALGDGPFQNVEVTVQTTGGDGKLVAVATVNDNVSRNPEVFVLGPN